MDKGLETELGGVYQAEGKPRGHICVSAAMLSAW